MSNDVVVNMSVRIKSDEGDLNTESKKVKRNVRHARLEY